jgi:glycosyltransferase involved in cell wall biosynthesis
VEKKDVWNVFQEADALIISLQKTELFKYGISPNKLFDYMASSKPIILCINSKNNPVKESGCGITASVDDYKEMARAAAMLYRMPIEQRMEMGKRGRVYVEQNNSIKALAENLAKTINDAINDN